MDTVILELVGAMAQNTNVMLSYSIKCFQKSPQLAQMYFCDTMENRLYVVLALAGM